MAFCVAVATFGNSSPALAKTATPEPFDITKEPRTGDWREFLRAPEAKRERLWAYHQKLGHTLGDWAWGWRMGWVRSCTESKAKFCAEILEAALFDDALVVRAEAATRLGRRHEGTQDERATQLLVRAFQNPRNARNKKPLFVQQRIIFALAQIGGEAAKKAAERLAKSHPQSLSYWKKLQDRG